MIIINYLLTLMESQTVLQHSPSKKNIMAPNCLGKIQVTGGREISSRLKLDWAIFFFQCIFFMFKTSPHLLQLENAATLFCCQAKWKCFVDHDVTSPDFHRFEGEKIMIVFSLLAIISFNSVCLSLLLMVS